MLIVSRTNVIIFIILLFDFLNQIEILGAIHIGSMNVYIFDFISVFLFSLSLPFFISKNRQSWTKNLLILYFLLGLASFILGSIYYGSKAGVAYRQDFLVIVLIFFMITSKKQATAKDLVTILLIYSSFAVLTIVLRSFEIIHMSAFSLTLNTDEASFISYRLIGSDYALALAMFASASLILGFTRGYKNINHLYFIGTGLIALLISISSMHRSVWLSMLIGLATLLWITKWYLSARLRFRLSITLGILLTIGFMFIWSFMSDFIIQAFSEIYQENSTMMWRILGWQALIDKSSGLQILWGASYGADMSRIVLDQEIISSAHNLFVHIYFYTGLLGLFLYLAIMYIIFKGLYSVLRKGLYLEDRVLSAILITLFFMLFIYHFSYGQWILDAIVYGYSLNFLSSNSCLKSQGKINQNISVT